MRRAIVCLLVALSLACLASQEGRAQSAPRMPDANGLTVLVRTTIIALNHANRTGNYTVFRDLGSPDFQKPNTAAKLASIFAEHRAQNLDLGPIVLAQPKFTRQPGINKQGMLRLTGFFPTKPLRLQFDIAYQWIESGWRLFGISIQTKPASEPKKKQ